MKKLLRIALLVLLFISVNVLFTVQAIALPNKNKKKNQPVSYQSIEALTVDGSNYIYGGVLDPNVNQVLFLLPKQLLYSIRKLSLTKLNITLNSALDSTKTYTVPLNALSIQPKRIKGKFGRYFVANISNLTTPSGITISPSSLPTGDYRVRIIGNDLDVTTTSVKYYTPTLIVGTVKSKNQGFITVEDLDGNVISEKIVAISPAGTFLTEVRANNIKQFSKAEIKNRVLKYKKIDAEINKFQTDEDDEENKKDDEKDHNVEIITGNNLTATGVIHAVTDKDLFAVVPLDTDVEKNAAKIQKPIEVSESTTLTTLLGKEYDELAEEATEEELKDLESTTEEETETFEDFGCDINQFASKCKIASEDENILKEIGSDFKTFLLTADCDFPEFNLLRDVITAAPDEVNLNIGIGYCINSEAFENINEERICQEYSNIISDFKSGVLSQLPCPPPECIDFKSIKPPKCVKPLEFCEEVEDSPKTVEASSVCRGAKCKTPLCINRPIRDLYCARIGQDVSEIECLNGIDLRGRSSSWTIISSLKGNQYCVPGGLATHEIAEECEIGSCHRICEEIYSSSNTGKNFTPAVNDGNIPKCEVCDCHFSCDAEAGRIVDCGNPRSKYFSIKCCDSRVIGPTLFTQVSQPGFQTPRNGAIPVNIRQCLCNNTGNFDGKGFAYQFAQESCKNNCPPGYEKDPNSDSCLITCQEGLVRDPRGFCRRKCPEGFIEDDSGICKCPEGQFVSRSGKCENLSGNCPDFCRNITAVREFLNRHDSTSSGPSYYPGASPGSFPSSPSSPGFVPEECRRCFEVGGGQCPQGQKINPYTGQCQEESKCGQDQYLDSNRNCRCNTDGRIPGPEGCSTRPLCESNMQPNPRSNEPNQAPCICAIDMPYWDGTQCRPNCPSGTAPETKNNSLIGSPITCKALSTQIQCPAASPYIYKSGCISVCPVPLVPGIPQGSGYTPPSTGPGYTPPSTGPGHTPPSIGPGYTPPRFKATLKANHDLTGHSGNTQNQLECLCPDGARPDANGNCGSTQRTCGFVDAPIRDNCICAQGATPSGPNGECRCTNGANYTSTGCGNAPLPHTCGQGESYNASNPCTCAGGAYQYQGICTCPTGQTYSVNGCTGTTTRNCYPGENPKFSNCVCATGSTPIAAATTFSDTTGGGSLSYCQCPVGQTYTVNGCTSPTTRNCYPGENPKLNNCVCAPGSTPIAAATTFSDTTGGGSLSYCQCPAGQTYSVSGCSGTTTDSITLNSVSLDGEYITVNGSSSITSYTTCIDLKTNNNEIINTSSFSCGPFIGYTGPTTSFNSNLRSGTLVKLCIRNSQTCSQPVTVISKPVCTPGQIYTTGNPCTCAVGGGAQFKSYSEKICTCPGGITYTASGCGGTTTNTCTANQVSTATNPCTCASGATILTGGSCQCTNGQTYTGVPCTTSTPTPTPTPSPTPTPAADSVTLSSIVISGSNATVNYTKNFTTCVHLLNPNNTILHTQNHFCANAGPVTVSTTSFNPALFVGQQVKLCHGNNYGICSPLVAVTSTSSPTPTPTSTPTPTASVPTAPSNLVVTSPSDGTVNLTWADNSNNENYFAIYRRVPAIGSSTSVSTTSTNITSKTESNLSAATYEYRVKACNTYGCSVDSNTVTVTVQAATTASIPVAPTNLVVTSPSDGTVNLTWADNSNNENYFAIYRKVPALGYSTSVSTTSANITSKTESNLDAATYEYRVKACNSYGCSPDSNIVSVPVSAPIQASIPNPPSNLAASSTSPGTVNLSWSDNSTNENYFAIYRKLPAVSSTTNVSTVTSNITTKTETGLADGTYEYRAKACNTYGCSADSNIVSITVSSTPTPTPTPTPTIPAAVTNLAASLSGSGSVALTWTDNSNNETSFSVYRQPAGAGGGTNWTLLTSTLATDTTTYTNTNVPAGSYDYAVYACNAAGCSSPGSNVATITVTAQRIALHAVGVYGDTIYFNFTKDTTDSFKAYTSTGVLLNVPNHAFGGVSGTSYPLSTLNNNLQANTELKICYSSEPTVCSNTLTLALSFSPHTCAVNEAYSSANVCNCANGANPNLSNICTCPAGQIYSANGCTAGTISLNSVNFTNLSGGAPGTGIYLGINFTKSFSDCVRVKDINNVDLNTGSTSNLCYSSTNIRISEFSSQVMAGTQVKLCTADNSVCSLPVTIGGSLACFPNQTPASSSQGCVCPSPSTTGTSGYCKCASGYSYIDTGSGVDCRRFCNVAETYDYTNPCACGASAYQTSTGCTCTNGATYNATTGCGTELVTGTASQ